MPISKNYRYEATYEWTPYEGKFAGQVCGDPYWFDSMQSDPIKACIDETIRKRNINLDPSVYIVGATLVEETEQESTDSPALPQGRPPDPEDPTDPRTTKEDF